MATIDEVIEGLKILKTYGAGSIDAQHDIIYAGPDEDSKMSKEDVKKLKELGWHYDKEFSCWARFT